MENSRIDTLILAAVDGNWSKVARVIGIIADVEKVDVSRIDEMGLVVQARLEVLIQTGILEVQGNIQKWRHSEVRRT
ncbi:DUF3658 domain-containing protein [Rugamonas apoptosis]|uniref:DUF3658 domain-containing protein n=1 Tax=Rugamonas apoptosis TaxID=2758570 RepID=A0A7W2IKL9_9BURK|nr:hypothetical protein [Rugamonas apoptosis]